LLVLRSQFSLSPTYVSSSQEIRKEERRRIERMMSRCFTWFPIGGYRRTQYIPRFGGGLQECGDFTWRASDCEELVGA